MKNVAHLTAATVQSPVSDVISLLRIIVLLRTIRKQGSCPMSASDDGAERSGLRVNRCEAMPAMGPTGPSVRRKKKSGRSGRRKFTTQRRETGRCLFTALAHQRFCAGNAFATAGADIELGANFCKRARPRIHGSADGSVRHIVANADNHEAPVICKCEQFLFRLLTKRW